MMYYVTYSIKIDGTFYRDIFTRAVISEMNKRHPQFAIASDCDCSFAFWLGIDAEE